MHSTQYLYGIDPEELYGMYYYDALEYKYEKGKELYFRLYNEDRDEDADIRMFYVNKAVEHTAGLIDERTTVE